jgi:hypothetical protein
LADIQRSVNPAGIAAGAPTDAGTGTAGAPFDANVHNALQLILRCEKLTAKDGIGKKSGS